MSIDYLDWNTVERFIPAFMAVGSLAWWLSGKFRAVEDRSEKRLSELSKVQQEALNVHEGRDQIRHEENLRRFEKISVSLARLGSDNGTYGHEEETQ